MALTLKDDPRIQRRRYTFGDDIIGAWKHGAGSLHGQGWWAIEPTKDGGWDLVHGGELVPMYGGATEEGLLSSNENPWRVRVSSDPEFCLRDFEATHILDGKLSFETTWMMVPKLGW